MPDAFVTVTATGYEPAAGMVPEMMPVDAAMVSPLGRPVAVNVSGACPVAGMAKRKGVAGEAAAENGPCSRGVAGAAVIEIMMVVCARATFAVARVPSTAVEMSAETRRRDFKGGLVFLPGRIVRTPGNSMRGASEQSMTKKMRRGDARILS